MDKIVLDFTGCKYLGEIHKVIKESFGFPDYYGKNWDNLWDCLDYYCHSSLIIEVRGITSLPKDFDEQVQIMLDIFRDVHKHTPNMEFILTS